MDKLAAYRVLGLNENASLEEIKEAYAALSKEYHPEENPEEFQMLHEAYVTLTRRGRRTQTFVAEAASPIEQTAKNEKRRNELVFEHVHQVEEVEEPVPEVDEEKAQALVYARSIHNAQKQNDETVEEKVEFDFDASMEQAEKEESENIWRMGRQLADELDDMFSSSNYNNPKKIKAFFEREEYKKGLFSEVFIASLAKQLGETPVKPAIYSFLIQFYQLKGKRPEHLIPEAQRLYHVIDGRYSIVKDSYAAQKTNTRIGVGAGIIGGLISAGRSILKYGPKILRTYFNDFYEDISFFIPFTILVAGGFLIYKFFAKRTSSYLAQAVVAAQLFLVSIIDLVFGIWKPFFEASGNNNATLSGYTLILSIIWLLVSLVKLGAEERKAENQ